VTIFFIIFFRGLKGMTEKKKGEFTVIQRKKKREIIEEGWHQVDVPPDVGDQEKNALEQTGEDATSGW
jgi:hypothetical protein